VIQIDVHPAGENLTNTTRMLHMPVHVRPSYASYMRSLYGATFCESSIGLDGFTAPEKKVLPTPPLSLVEWSTGPISVLSQHSHWSSVLKPSTCRQQTTRLTGPISPACDRYVQYLLTGTNPSVLNRHMRGLSHRKPLNSHSTLPALPFREFHWSP
jgi:hypothetical protein